MMTILRNILLVVLLATPLHATLRWVTLEAIHQVENPGNSPRRGSKGELGAYQFMASTWRMYSREPFSRAVDRAASDRVAVSHYEWIKAGLEKAGFPATPYVVALAWNCGLSATVEGRVPEVSRQYAKRVAAIAGELQDRVDAQARPKPVVPVFKVDGTPVVYFVMR